MVDAIGLERLEKICNSNFATSINLCLSLSLVCGRDVFTEAREALHKVTTLQYSCSEGVFNNFVKDYANATVAVFRRYGETLEKPTRRARHTESRTTFFKKIKLILDELHLVVPKIVPGTDEPFLTHYNACLTQLDADISLSKSRLAKAKARDGAPRPATIKDQGELESAASTPSAGTRFWPEARIARPMGCRIPPAFAGGGGAAS